MKVRDFVLLVLDASGGKIQGRTRLQKITYFVGLLTDQLGDLGYDAAFYGPYSALVQDAVDELENAGVLQTSIVHTRRINNRGFEVVRYDYEFTEAGNDFAERLKASDGYSDLSEQVQQQVEGLKQAGNLNYVELSIAAKTWFLLKKEGGHATTSKIRTLAGQLNWEVTEEEIGRAAQFLENLELVTVS